MDVNLSNIWWFLCMLVEKYGEIFKIKVLGYEIVFVVSVVLVEEICDEIWFCKFVGGFIVEIWYVVYDVLFIVYDYEEFWGIVYCIIVLYLSMELVVDYFDEFLLCIDELIVKWIKGFEFGIKF